MPALVDNATEALLTVQLQGYCPHSCIYLPFGDMQQPNFWFNPAKFGDVKLKLTGEAALGVTKVFTQQLRTGD